MTIARLYFRSKISYQRAQCIPGDATSTRPARAKLLGDGVVMSFALGVINTLQPGHFSCSSLLPAGVE